MKYNFDEVVDRRGTGSEKWNVRENELPMWVADMDFPAAPCIRRMIEKRVAHGVFGYSCIPAEWAKAYRNWWGMHHGLNMECGELLFATGVIPALASAIHLFTHSGDSIIIQTPVYNHFFTSIRSNGRQVLENPLIYRDGKYEMDFEDLEKKLVVPGVSLLILCNPQNPVGKIWSREDLAMVGKLCEKYHVPVFSDEIHCDLTAPDKGYIPFASVDDICRMNSVTALAPTKAFNIAGLKTAAVCVPNEDYRQRMEQMLGADEAADPGAFAMDAVTAAFSDEGWEWLTALRDYTEENKKKASAFIEKEMPDVHAVPQDATYLMWLDISRCTDRSDEFQRFLRKETGLYVTPGTIYGGNGNLFLRLNVACPRTLLEDGLNRLKTGLELWRQKQ
jgi:cystathionine beta-lyase